MIAYWQKQTDEPLFPDLIWSRPENKKYAGKLLIIGGQAGEFAHVARAFETASKAGAGSIRVLLPESLRKQAQLIPEVEFAGANKSGSFAKTALSSWFELSEWADHVLLAGDLGKNSETTTILDGFLLRGNCPTTLNLNSLTSIGLDWKQLLNRPLTLILNRLALQKIGIYLALETPIKSTTPSAKFAEILQKLSSESTANLVIQDEGQIWVAAGGRVVSTKSKQIDNAKLSAICAVWLMQNPSKPLEALASSSYALI